METVSSATTPNNYTPFRIKDLMLGELLCQAGIISDSQLIELTKLARAVRWSLGSAIVFSNVLSASELFLARRLLNRYLCDLDCPMHYIDELRTMLTNTSAAPASAGNTRIIRSNRGNQVLVRVS